MVNRLFKMKKWEEWDIEVEAEPARLESRRLAAPELLHKEGQDKQLFCTERLLKMMPVYSSDDLQKAQMILIFDKYSKREADSALMNIQKCQNQIGIKTAEIEKLCLPDCKNNFKRIEESIDGFIRELDGCSDEQRTYFAVVILERRNDYPRIK